MVKAVIGEGILSVFLVKCEIQSTPVDSSITFLGVLDGDLEVVSFSSISERVLIIIIIIRIQAIAGQTVFSLAEKVSTSTVLVVVLY